MTFLLLLLACDRVASVLPGADVADPLPTLPSAPASPVVALQTPSGAVRWRGLDQLGSATIVLPSAAPSPAEAVARWEITGPWTPRKGKLAGFTGWTTPLPFFHEAPRPNYAPWNATVTLDGTTIPYVNQAADVEGVGWLVEADQLTWLGKSAPGRPIVLEAPALASALRARQWDPAAGSAAAFVRVEATEGRVTWQGLHLPAGGTVAAREVGSAGSFLKVGAMRHPHPLGPTHDTGVVEVVVRATGADGAARELARWRVAPGDPHAEHEVALEGTATTLTFAAEGVDGDASGHVVLTSPVVVTKPARPVRRVVMIGVDTLRPDALGLNGYARPTSPGLDAWASQVVVFDRAWAPAPRTFPSFRTALTGRQPIAARSAPTLARHLYDAGFRTGGVVANVHLVPRFGFNEGFERWDYENGARAGEELDRARSWLDAHVDEDSFLFLHLMDPHTWYNAPEPWGSRFNPGPRPAGLPEVFERWQVLNLMKKPSWSAAHTAWIRGAYDGEVAYTSAQLSRFLEDVTKLPGDTLVVLHSDHGEEFWDHGGFEHNHSLSDDLVRAVLWIRPPGGWAGGPHRVKAPVGLVDIVPTVLDLVGAPLGTTDGTSLRPFVDAAQAGEVAARTASLVDRPLPLGHLMFGTERWGVVAQDQKYILHTTSGREEVYDLVRDPGEQHDRAATVTPEELHTLRGALARATGAPVRPGWRLTPRGETRAFTVRFDGAIADAGVLDPDAGQEIRANIEWGETPRVSAADVGEVTLAPDRRSFQFLPGPRAATGTLYVTCEGACPEGALESTAADGAPVRTKIREGDIHLGKLRVGMKPGTIFLPPRGEAAAAPSDDQRAALEALGYLGGD